MHIIYTCEEPPQTFSKSIFLAGPTARTTDVKSWRPEALRLLEAADYDGIVYVPEHRDGTLGDEGYDWETIPKWERDMMNMSDRILFYVPRNMTTLPALTTNVEFGLESHLGRMVFGNPKEAVRNRYLSFVAKGYKIPEFTTLEEAVNETVRLIGLGAERTGGEREVPLELWDTLTFQLWYQAQKAVGNRLDGAKVEWIFKAPSNRKIFYWALYANIYVASENRNKLNERFVSRFDISTILLYRGAKNLLDTQIVLAKEFRSSVRNGECFVYELPGGSSPKPDSGILDTAQEELSEEVGLEIDKSRLRLHGSRQLMATISAHHANLLSAELTEKELEWIRSQKGIVRGADLDNPTGERIYLEIQTLGEIIEKKLVDYSNVGMITSALLQIDEKGE